MVKQKIFLSSVLGLTCSAFLISAFPAIAKNSSQLPIYDVSEGDGDPSENAAPELLNDEKNETAEDAVATITAEGDFLLPTYLLPVEGEAKEDAEKKAEMIQVDATQTNTQDIPGLMAENQAREASVSMDTATNETITDEIQMPAGQEDIDIDIDTNALQQAPAEPAAQIAPRNIGAGHAANAPRMASNNTKPVLIPLTPLKEAPAAEPLLPVRKRHVVPSEYADNMLNALDQNTRPNFIMPQEIKVSFYENATEFSGQTLKWIKAFSMNAINDPRLIIQIRLSTVDPSIQNKRLLILQNALMGYGLSSHQLQVVYTDRPVNSLVLRTTTKPEQAEVVVKKSSTGKKIEKRTTTW